jgi:hypothetical protein
MKALTLILLCALPGCSGVAITEADCSTTPVSAGGYIYRCAEPSSSPGVAGECKPALDANGERVETAGLAVAWECAGPKPKDSPRAPETKP